MDVLKLVLLGAAAALMAVLLKNQRPELALLLSLAACAFLLLLTLGYAGDVVSYVDGLCERLALPGEYLAIAVKTAGVAIVADAGAALCRDAGESAVASKIELGAKAAMIVMALPVFDGILGAVGSLLL